MNEAFRQRVEQLHPKFEALMTMIPVTLATLPKGAENRDLSAGGRLVRRR